VGGEDVLIVEDEPIPAMELQSTLEALEYNVLGMEKRGEEVLDRLESESADLVLMDIRLDGDMDGIETAEKIRDRSPSTSIVFLTAYSDEETLERAREIKPEGYLVKPITENDLKSTLKMALSRGKD
jgi:DNA-binding NarL/FixJ family response regulator